MPDAYISRYDFNHSAVSITLTGCQPLCSIGDNQAGTDGSDIKLHCQHAGTIYAVYGKWQGKDPTSLEWQPGGEGESGATQ